MNHPIAGAGGARIAPTFSCTFANAEFFSSFVNVLRDFVDVIEMMIVPEGIKIKMMDSAQVFLVDFELYSDTAFAEYVIHGGPHTIALKIEPMYNICKNFKKNDVVKMYTKDSDSIYFTVARHEKFGQRSMTYKLFQVTLSNHDQLDMPDMMGMKCQAMVPADVFVSISNELRDLGGQKITISISQQAINFKSKNDHGEAVIVMRAADGFASGTFGIKSDVPCEESFMQKHFNRMVKAATLKQTDSCVIGLETNTPLTVMFDVQPYGALRFFLAPMLAPE